jgi:hypothetical protein
VEKNKNFQPMNKKFRKSLENKGLFLLHLQN